MPITEIDGPIGAGKTYHVITEFILPAVIERRRVWTNIEGLNVREISHLTGVPLCEINIKVVPDKDAWERKLRLPEKDLQYRSVRNLAASLVVIDEAQLIWYNRDYEKTSKEFIFFLTKSRHIDCDIVFISQHIDNVDVAIRRLGNYFYHVYEKKLLGLRIFKNKYGVDMRLSSDPLAPTFTSESFTRQPKYFRCFCSAQSADNQMKKKFPVPRIIWYVFFIAIFGALAFARWKYKKGNVFRARTVAAPVMPLPQSPVDLPGLPRPSASNVVLVDSGPALGVSVSSCTTRRVGGCFEMGGSRECKYDYVCR